MIPPKLQAKIDADAENYLRYFSKLKYQDRLQVPAIGYKEGAKQMFAELEPLLLELVDTLEDKCMCWPDDDKRKSRNPCHVCILIAKYKELLGDEK